MAMSIASLISALRQTLQDTIENQHRWPDDELLTYINEAQVEISKLRPDAYIVSGPIASKAGIFQSIPSGGICLMDVVANTNGRPIIRVDERELSLQHPGWRSEAQKSEATAFMFDKSAPKNFTVYPQSTGSGQYDVIYSAIPPVAVAGGSVALPDEYVPSIKHYVCFMAYNTDSTGPDTNKAAMFNGLFLSSLQLPKQAAMESSED